MRKKYAKIYQRWIKNMQKNYFLTSFKNWVRMTFALNLITTTKWKKSIHFILCSFITLVERILIQYPIVFAVHVCTLDKVMMINIDARQIKMISIFGQQIWCPNVKTSALISKKDMLVISTQIKTMFVPLENVSCTNGNIMKWKCIPH